MTRLPKNVGAEVQVAAREGKVLDRESIDSVGLTGGSLKYDERLGVLRPCQAAVAFKLAAGRLQFAGGNRPGRVAVRQQVCPETARASEALHEAQRAEDGNHPAFLNLNQGQQGSPARGKQTPDYTARQNGMREQPCSAKIKNIHRVRRGAIEHILRHARVLRVGDSPNEQSSRGVAHGSRAGRNVLRDPKQCRLRRSVRTGPAERNDRGWQRPHAVMPQGALQIAKAKNRLDH